MKCFMVKLYRLDKEKQSYFLICNLFSLKLNIIFQLYCSQSTICIVLLSFSVIFVPFQSLLPLDFPTFLICLYIYLPYKACPKHKAQSPNHIAFPTIPWRYPALPITHANPSKCFLHPSTTQPTLTTAEHNSLIVFQSSHIEGITRTFPTAVLLLEQFCGTEHVFFLLTAFSPFI